MTSPLLGLAATIGSAMDFLFLDASLIREVAATIVDPADPAAPTTHTYSCKAIVENYSNRMRLEGLVKQNDRKVLILATSLAVTPLVKDNILIGGTKFVIQDVETDPATAVWVCQGRF